MASFTDAIPKFNPYIQQLPVEAMVQVGMEKQKRYDEGVQKIQQSIDSVGGLDIAKDADKAYLQSKLNQLTNNLKTFAASDFSEFQLVNTVAGMTNEIIKDPTIQNAVNSTAILRKEQQRKEKAIQDGKSSPENEYYFDNQVSKYLQSSELGESFNGRYIEYTDVDKKLRDVVSKLKDMDYKIDNPYVRDSATGKTIYFNPDGTQSLDSSKGGKPMIDEMMLSTTVKGTSAEKILNNFYASLDENDKRQLNITAQYHYRNATPVTFQNDIIRTYNEKKQIYSDAIIDYSVALATQQLTNDQKKFLTRKINEAKELVYGGGFDKQMQEDLSKVDTDAEVEIYKYKLYSQKYLTGLSKALANEAISTEYKSNPGFQALMDKKKFQFDVAKEARRQQEWNADYDLRLRKDSREQRKADREEQENLKLQPIVKDASIPTEGAKIPLQTLDNDIQQISSTIDAVKMQLGEYVLKDSPTLLGLNKEQVKKEKLKAAEKWYEIYKQNPKNISDNGIRELVQQVEQLEPQLHLKANIKKAVIEAGQPFEKQLNEAIGKQSGLRVGNVTYTATELYDFYSNATKNYSKNFTIYGTGGGGQTLGTSSLSSTTSKGFDESIVEKYKNTKFYPLALTLFKSNRGEGLLNDNEKKIYGKIKSIRQNVSEDAKKINYEKLQAQQDAYAKLDPQFQGKIIVINPENKTDKNLIDQILAIKINEFSQQGALDSEKPGDFNPETLAQIKKAGVQGYEYLKKPDGSADLIVIGNTGERQVVPLTSQEFSDWLPNYAYTSPINEVKAFINSSPEKTTNLQGRKLAETAGISGYSPLVPMLNTSTLAEKVKIDVEGSPSNIGDSSDRFQIRIYYHNGNEWKDEVLNNGGYLNELGLQDMLTKIGPGTIKSLFK